MDRRLDAERPPLARPTDVSVSDRDDADDSTPGTTVEVCVRSLSDEAQPLLDETLRRLWDSTDVDEVSVVVWGRSFDPTGPAAATGTGRALADRLRTFREWASANGASFGPFFGTRTVERITGDAYTRVELPTVALAEYHDDELAFVAPCWMGDRHHGVLDRVDRLATGSTGVSERPAAADPPEYLEPTGGNGASIRT